MLANRAQGVTAALMDDMLIAPEDAQRVFQSLSTGNPAAMEEYIRTGQGA